MSEDRQKFFDVVIGTGEECNFIFDDDYMSRRHARVVGYTDHTVTIEDLGTTNGTWVNGVRIIAPRTLRPGDQIRVGHTDIPIPSLDELLPNRGVVKVG